MKAFGAVAAIALALFATAMLVAWIAGWSMDSGMDDARGPGLVALATIAALASAGVLAGMRQDFSRTAFSLIAWAGIFVLVILGYSYRDDVSRMWDRVRSELFAGEVRTTGERTVEVARSGDSHFYIRATIDGNDVEFVVDTGATSVALTWDDARRAGLDPERLRFDQRVQTASGTALAASARIGRLSIGPIERQGMMVTVLPEGGGQSLLGMSFLNTLRSYEVSGNRLILRD
jgi:aspartyl protease family protein